MDKPARDAIKHLTMALINVCSAVKSSGACDVTPILISAQIDIRCALDVLNEDEKETKGLPPSDEEVDRLIEAARDVDTLPLELEQGDARGPADAISDHANKNDPEYVS